MHAEPTTRPPVVRTTFAGAANTPGAARAFVRETLRAWDLSLLIDDAEVIVSELVTNAVKATQGRARHGGDLHNLDPVGVELHLDAGAFRIAVRDGSRERPTLQTVGDDAENGRGLFLVEALSARWDDFFVAGGKVTWAELDVPAGERA